MEQNPSSRILCICSNDTIWEQVAQVTSRQPDWACTRVSTVLQAAERCQDTNFHAVLLYQGDCPDRSLQTALANCGGCALLVIGAEGQPEPEEIGSEVPANRTWIDFISWEDCTTTTLARALRYAIAWQQQCAVQVESSSGPKVAEVLESINDGFFALDPQWRFVYINQRAANNGGMQPSELIGKSIWEMFPRLIGTKLWSSYHQVMETRQPVQFEMAGIQTNLWYEVRVFPSDSGISVYWIDKSEQHAAHIEQEHLLQQLREAHDQTEKSATLARQAAREARSAATRLEAIINSLTDGVVVLDASGHVQLANSYAIAMFGFDPMRMNLSVLLRRITITARDGSVIPVSQLPFRRAQKGELVFNQPLLVTNRRGRTYRILASALPMNVGQEFTGIVSIWDDVSERERLRQANQQLTAEQLEHQMRAEVQRQLVRHREMERSQIARDLHEGPLQDIIASSYELSEAMRVEDKLERLQRMQAVQSAIQSHIRGLRTFCNDLRPPVLGPFGLEKTIRSYIEGFRARNPEIRVELDLVDDGKRLPETVRTMLFRVYQEVLNNIQRHAHATVVNVRLQMDDEAVQFAVEDNGVGFHLPKNWVEIARQGHHGLVGMRERVDAISGTLQVLTEPGHGTKVEIRVPLSSTGEKRAVPENPS